jgi:hypothetical protein
MPSCIAKPVSPYPWLSTAIRPSTPPEPNRLLQETAMEHHDRHDNLDHRPPITRATLQFGLWLRGTFIGIALAGAGIAALFNPPPGVSALMALTWVAAGATLTRLAVSRVAAALDRMDPVGRSTERNAAALLVRGVKRAGATS